jgi:hypothetical protein
MSNPADLGSGLESPRTATAAWAAAGRERLEQAADLAGGEFPVTDQAGPGAVAEVLDELARVVALLPDTVSRVTGGAVGAVERLAGQLSAVLVAQRNLAHRRDPTNTD